MARLSILTKEEICSLYSIPKLDYEEQSFLFTLEEEDKTYIETLEDTSRKVNYILQLGYYRATNYFFMFSFQKHQSDVEFILKLYFQGEPFPKKQILKKYHYKNRTEVMRKYGLTDSSREFEEQLLKEAKSLSKRHVLPRFVLQGLLSFCLQKNVIKPAYSTLQGIVSDALKYERNRLINIFYTDADKDLRNQLDKLLDNENLFYNLTLLKNDQKNFTTTEIKKSVEKQKMIIGIYKKSLLLVPKLGISEQNIIYYANLAEFYTIPKLRQLTNKNQGRLFLLCYAHRRLLKINDHLIFSLIQKVTKSIDNAKEYQQTKVDIAETVDAQLRDQACELLAININEAIPDEQIREMAFQIVPKADYKQFLSDFKKPNLSRDYYRWECYGKQALTIKRNIRPIFKVVDFSCAHEGMENAVTFLKQHFKNNKSFRDYHYHEFPLAFFPESIKKFLTYKSRNSDNSSIKKINGDRYEFMVYLQLSKGIADGTVFIKDSNCYRALEDELIDVEYWGKHKKEILTQLNMPPLSMEIVEFLDHHESNLDRKYQVVNQRIRCGENTSLKTKYNRKGELIKWTLPYTPLDDGINNPFYEQLPVLGICDIIRFVADSTDFLKSFSHIQPKYAKTVPDPEVIYASIVANATGIETKKMKDISDVKEQDLDNVNKNFIRYQTLCSASDLIINQTAKLPIFKEFDLSDYGVHASVDGQKFATKYNTIKSRHSKKYFGMMETTKNRGLIQMTLFQLPI